MGSPDQGDEGHTEEDQFLLWKKRCCMGMLGYHISLGFPGRK